MRAALFTDLIMTVASFGLSTAWPTYAKRGSFDLLPWLVMLAIVVLIIDITLALMHFGVVGPTELAASE